ncbi:hypothetical protein CR513_48655, partial [Mucuna pruriens]
MGNCLDLCEPSPGSCIAKKVKLVRVAKPDGKVLEFSTPVHVKDILTNYPAYGVGVSEKVTEPLSPDHELKAGRLYYLLPSLHSPGNLISSNTGGGIKRIKVVITKKQLEQLVTKKISVEDLLLLSEVQTVAVNFPSNQKSKLDSIPEENDHEGHGHCCIALLFSLRRFDLLGAYDQFDVSKQNTTLI